MIMDNLDDTKYDHQKNKSDIVNPVKQMFALDKWGGCRIQKRVTRIGKERRGFS